MLDQIQQQGASIPAAEAAFMRPVSGGMVTSPFGYRTSGFHKGVDIKLHLQEHRFMHLQKEQ